MGEVEVDIRVFYIRSKALIEKWQANLEETGPFGNATSLVIAAGARDEDNPYKKSTVLQNWLIGYECPDTILMYAKTGDSYTAYLFASKSKIKLLGSLSEKPEDIDFDLKVEFIERIKKGDNTENYKKLIKAGGERIGTLLADMASQDEPGAFVQGWQKCLEDEDINTVEIATGCSMSMSKKDAREIKLITNASVASDKALKRFLLKPIEDALEEDKSPSHRKLTEAAEDALYDANQLKRLKLPIDESQLSLVDSCYTPIVQSGGSFDLKPSAVSNDKPLDAGVIVCSLGCRYQAYCSNVARTYLIDPTPKHKSAYEKVLTAYEAGRKALKVGNVAGDVHKAVSEALGDLSSGLLRHVGFGIGLEFRESHLSLKASNTTPLEEGMTFALRVALSVDKFAILLSDTVVVENDGGRFLTNLPRGFKDVSYDLSGSEDEEAPRDKKKSKQMVDAANIQLGGRRTRRAARGNDQQTEKDQEALAERNAHQRELAEKMQRDAFKRLTKGDDGKKKIKLKAAKDFIAYTNNVDIPREANKSKLAVDRRQKVILMPIHGYIVPMHIATLKAVTKTDSYLRFQFITPISVIPRDEASKIFANKQAIFIKEAAFHVPDEAHLQSVFRQVKEVRKQFNDEQAQMRAVQTIVKQDQLELAKGRAIRLTDVYLRPSLTRGKTSGTLEAHANGFRFRSDKGGRVDIIYQNIKHAFFQPAEKELITVVHFHLHDEIIINKKKVRDIQFYTEVMEASQALDARLQSYDGIEEENRERAMRNKINQTFENFVKKVDEQVQDVEFDIPYRELGFHGAPNKSNVLLQPTVNCLISITESPFFVLTLNEVEFVHFERVHFNNKTFDMVMIMKDYTKQVVSVRSVQRDQIDAIRDWLDSVNIPFTEGAVTYKWAMLLKRAREDPHSFFEEEGGWGFLTGEVGSDDESDDEDEDVFQPGDDDDDESEDFEDEDEEDSYEEESGDEEVSEVSDGLDWDELEAKAKQADRKKHSREDEDDHQPKRRRK